MSNVNKPISVPSGVEVKLSDGAIKVKGPVGQLERTDLPAALGFEFDESAREIRVARHSDERESRCMHGLFRALINNMVIGVTQGFVKELEIHGTGYNVNLQGKKLVFQIGFCHAVEMPLPASVEAEVAINAAQPNNPARFKLKGPDKEVLGQFAAEVRAKRPPEPYKGKGIRYSDETVRRKEGKAFAGSE